MALYYVTRKKKKPSITITTDIHESIHLVLLLIFLVTISLFPQPPFQTDKTVMNHQVLIDEH